MLVPLYIKKTETSPEVILDKEKGIFSIVGDILVEDSFSFFEPIFKWFKQYVSEPNEETKFLIDCRLINTSSTRRIVSLLKILDEIASKGYKVETKFLYLPEDEMMEYFIFEISNAFPKINVISKRL